MTQWDLSRLRYTVRKLTGKFDTNQLPDASPGAGAVSVSNPPGVDDYINDFYLYDFPEHLRTLKLRDFFTFTTLPNVGTYNVPLDIVQIFDPIYIDNYQFAWYQDPNVFYRIWPELNFIDQAIATTSGNLTDTFTLTQTPVQQGTVVIGLQPNQDGNPSPQLETFVDQDYPSLLDQPTEQRFTNPGTLTGNLGGTGTIDYLTGAVSITYSMVVPLPPVGLNINAHYHPYVASRPRDIMFYQQQLFLRPIPNDVYAVKCMAYFQPTVILSALTNSPTFYPGNAAIQTPGIPSQFNGDNISGSVSMSTIPLFPEWWQVIAYGAALKILAEEGDYEEYAKLEVIFEKQKLLAQRKCLKQLANQRIPTPYADNNASGPAWPIFPIY
jgi:hypothetical protein